MQRFYFTLFCLLLIISTYGQGKKKKSPSAYNKANKQNEQFLSKQWWLGFKAGTNLSRITVLKEYSVISRTDDQQNLTQKKYENFTKPGTQAALEVTFTYQRISVSFQPTYRHARFVYSNDFEWLDNSDGNNSLILSYEQEHKVDHLEFPLVVKYEMGQHNLRPYFQVGGYYARLISANKSVKIDGIETTAGGTNEFETPEIIVGATDLFAKHHWGLIAGTGLNYHLGNVRFNFDIMYKLGSSNISSSSNRYGNDRLTGVGDALDDMTLSNLSFSIGGLFPLRFLGSGFKSIN